LEKIFAAIKGKKWVLGGGFPRKFHQKWCYKTDFRFEGERFFSSLNNRVVVRILDY